MADRRARFAAALLGVIALVGGGAGAAQRETTHGAWTVRCDQVDDDAAAECIMTQSLLLRAGGQPVLQITIGLAPADGLATVLLNLPLGIYLPPGISMSIDGAAPARFPVERCDPDGCQALLKLRESTVTQLRAGSRLEVSFHDAERAPLHLPLSLEGFGAAFDALSGSPPQ